MPPHENDQPGSPWPTRSVIGEKMSDEERLQRIGALFRKAAVLYWAAIDAGEIPPPPDYVEEPPAPPPPANDAERILDYLARVRHAAPLDLRYALGLSRATTQRRLAELLNAGRITATGKTHCRSYSLFAQPAAQRLPGPKTQASDHKP